MPESTRRTIVPARPLRRRSPWVVPGLAAGGLAGMLLLAYLSVGLLGRAAPARTAVPSVPPAVVPTAGPISPSARPLAVPSSTPFQARSSAPSTAPATAGLTAQPPSGSNGTTVVVAGSGWIPGVRVTLRYLDPTGTPTGAGATARPDQSGRFVVRIATVDPTNTPGPHRIVATSGRQSAGVVYVGAS